MIIRLNEIINKSKVEVRLFTCNLIDFAELEKKLEDETLNLKEKLGIEMVKSLGYVDGYIINKTNEGEKSRYVLADRAEGLVNFLDLSIPYYSYNIRPIDKSETELKIPLFETCYEVGIPLLRKLMIECEDEELYNELEAYAIKRVDDRFSRVFIKNIKDSRVPIPEEMIYELIYNDKLGKLYKTRIVFGRDTEVALEAVRQSYDISQRLLKSAKKTFF
jgi:hypothetical protein